ncbi:GTP-binding protein [Micromonospora sp. CPCC 205371]|nr:GTP-binding protein [Micromonospora sp. CPCC 205371]
MEVTTNASITVPPVEVDSRPAVTVLSGFSVAAAHAVARVLLAADDRLLLVSHDITAIRSGVVRRTVRGATGVVEDAEVGLVHGCVPCTLREDVLPTLVRLARSRPDADLVLVLPPVVEPEALADACAHCLVDGAPVTDAVRLDSFVTVVDAARVIDDLACTDDLRHRGLHAAENDHRAVADVVVRQIEYADTVLLWGHPEADGFDLARLVTLLHRLAPWATHLIAGQTATVDCTGLAARLRRTGRHDAGKPGMLGRALEGFPIAVHEPVSDCGVVSVVFRSRRPFHPRRLHGALEDLTGEALRGRGHLWIASQPDTVVGFESAGGGAGMGSLGYWLAALPTHRWDEASDHRRLAADLDWDPYYGDRHTVLAFVGLHLDAAAITELLTGCLLTDAEIADGFDAWRQLPDPFAGCFPLADSDDPTATEPSDAGDE